MTTRSLFLLLTVAAFGLAGCDAGDAAGDTADTSDVRASEDAAVSIANALGIESGGALEDVASAAAVGDDVSGKRADVGCERRLDYGEETQTWTHFVACERGREDSPFYAQFSRLHEFQFLAGDVPQQFPEGATTLLFDIVEGTGERRSPVFHHVLNDLGARFVVENVEDDGDRDLVRVNGTYTRAATDTLETRRVVRTLDYTLDLTFIDLVGPAHREMAGETDVPRDRGWNEAVSGTIEGHYQAFVTFETVRGYREQEIDETFVITFGGGSDQPELTIADERFTLDLETGTVVGVPMD